MKKIIFILFLIFVPPVFALTVDERDTAKLVLNKIIEKTEDIRRWVEFTQKMEVDAWTVNQNYGAGATTVSKTFNATEKLTIENKYNALKTDLKNLINQLP